MRAHLDQGELETEVPPTLDISMIPLINVTCTFVQPGIIATSRVINDLTPVSPAPVLTTYVVPQVAAINTPSNPTWPTNDS